ncbi:hypothetical protein Csa_019814 [Cucumis sativus]|nr:hypothetical protein Csa_019814 [Cucumis sativus]
MAKKMVHVSGGIGKKRRIKRSKKKYIHKVIDYLLSDCYLFAPLLISPSPIDNSHVTPTRGIEIRGRTKDSRTLVKKFQDYLQSDCYMYASLVTPKSPRLRGERDPKARRRIVVD